MRESEPQAGQPAESSAADDGRRCPSCGTSIRVDSPGGLCPECLLTAGLAHAGPPSGSQAAFSPFEATTPYPGMFVPPKPESLAAHFPQLELLETLGHGGMGAVYKARQKKLDRLVALKILRPESADDPAFAERFNREARTLARLHHPNIVSIHDFGEVPVSGGQPGEGDDAQKQRRLYYFLMEYVDGVSLREAMQTQQLRPDQTLIIMSQICDALQFAHDEHVVHRDIKPENILVDARGRVKIADFGLAKLVARAREDFTLTATHQVMGTPRYMAPEQMEGSHLVDHRADIYSLGVVFYEMLTGEIPAGHFEAPSNKAAVDSRLDRIVFKALAREPHRRYEHVSELKADILTVAGSSVTHALDRVVPAVERSATPEEQRMAERDYEMLRLEARGPAGGLILVGLLSAGFWTVIGFMLTADQPYHRGEYVATIGGCTGAVIAGCFIAYGGFHLRNLHAYELCVAASILTILPWSPVALLGIPIGVWCLRTLHRPDIKTAFVRATLRARGLDDVPLPRSTPPPDRDPRAAGNLQDSHDSQHSMMSSDQHPHGMPGPSTMIDRGVDAVGRWFLGK